MQASKVQRETIMRAAQEIGVTADVTTQNQAGTRHRVKLYPIVPDKAWAVTRWPRLCPVCGVKVDKRGETTDGRIIGTCGDAAPAAHWANGRRYTDERGDSPYQRRDARGNDRRVHAVCWHGFRDFFRAVYRIEPGAVFATAFDTWRGSEDFEARFRESGHKNIGSQMCPMAAAEACRCPESGRVDAFHSAVAVPRTVANIIRSLQTNPVDTYGADEADGAACRAMANALRAVR